MFGEERDGADSAICKIDRDFWEYYNKISQRKPKIVCVC
jgi:hypothetical protein